MINTDRSKGMNEIKPEKKRSVLCQVMEGLTFLVVFLAAGWAVREVRLNTARIEQLSSQVEQCRSEVEPTPAPSPPPVPEQLTKPLQPESKPAVAALNEWQQEMLDEHNEWRDIVAVPSLIWSPELAGYAQKLVDRLAANGCKMPPYGLASGVNLHFSGAKIYDSGRKEHSPKTPAQIVNKWGRGSDLYSYGNNSCAGVCGHYTQMVWKDTTEVGCARARCRNDGDLAGCLYDPPGNQDGKKPF